MALKNLVTRQINGINVIQISLVEESEPKDNYASKYFSFLKIIPGVSNPGSSTGRSYDHKAAITISLPIEKMLGLGFALKSFGEGKGDKYIETFGTFEIYADTTKSSYGGEGAKKSFKLGTLVNNKTQKKVITLLFTMNDKKYQGYFTPYEAYAFGKIIETLGERGLELECNRVHTMITPKQNLQNLQPNQYANPVDDLHQTMDNMPF